MTGLDLRLRVASPGLLALPWRRPLADWDVTQVALRDIPSGPAATSCASWRPTAACGPSSRCPPPPADPGGSAADLAFVELPTTELPALDPDGEP